MSQEYLLESLVKMEKPVCISDGLIDKVLKNI